MNIQELLNRTDRFAANAGCQITEVDTEHAVAEMIVTNVHLNGADVCQGGALFTLADLAIAALMNARGQQQHHVCVECERGRPSSCRSRQRL